MKLRWPSAAVLAAGVLLAGCSSGGSDKASCGIVQDSYSDMVAVLDRWQYGNAPNSDMLDALQDLADDANGQSGIARTANFKDAASDVGLSAQQVYRAVNSGVGFESAAKNLAAASLTMNSLCDAMR